MPGEQIYPSLIEHLTSRSIIKIPKSPTVSTLPGKYARLINRQKERIEGFFEENSFMLTCTTCGRKGKYDIGLMVINADLDMEKKDPEKTIQTTGYF